MSSRARSRTNDRLSSGIVTRRTKFFIVLYPIDLLFSGSPWHSCIYVLQSVTLRTLEVWGGLGHVPRGNAGFIDFDFPNFPVPKYHWVRSINFESHICVLTFSSFASETWRGSYHSKETWPSVNPTRGSFLSMETSDLCAYKMFLALSGVLQV